jgi:hypothetical protein
LGLLMVSCFLDLWFKSIISCMHHSCYIELLSRTAVLLQFLLIFCSFLSTYTNSCYWTLRYRLFLHSLCIIATKGRGTSSETPKLDWFRILEYIKLDCHNNENLRSISISIYCAYNPYFIRWWLFLFTKCYVSNLM